MGELCRQPGSSPQTNIAVGLHTADPGDSGNMSTSETGYTSYARVNVARTTGGWTETSGSVSPVANIDFPASTGGPDTVTNFARLRIMEPPPDFPRIPQPYRWAGNDTR